MSIAVRIAQATDLASVAALFDAYRQFYAQPADLALATRFIGERLAEGSSLLLVAQDDAGGLRGFTQLYPLFDSVGATRSFILYDLFVEPSARRSGVARALMEQALVHAKARGAGRVELQTAKDNFPAQKLYERLGWIRDNDFYVYAINP